MGDGVVEGLVAPLCAAVDLLLDASLTGLGSVEVAGLIGAVEVQRRRLVGVDARVVAEADARGVAGEYARTSTADLLTQLLRVSPREAKVRVAAARDTQPRTTLTGEVVAAVLPRCADAVRAGEISAEHVAVIASATERVSPHVAHEAVPVCEQLLVQAARHQHPGALSQTAALLLARLDPDGRAPDEAELQRRRGFTMARRGDGSARVSGEWTPEVTAVWDAILGSLAAPLPTHDDGERDTRSPAQRRHDAMAEAGQRLLRAGALPAAGGAPVTVLLRMNVDQLTDPGGVAHTATGDIWPAARVRANLADAAIVPIVIDQAGAVLWCGRTRRLATPAQRLALAARDGGCCFPGCTRPATWCEAHHVVAWTDGGPTDIDNLCLLCRHHHRCFAQLGWTLTMTDGLPCWTPPRWLDPQQQPLRNTAHHPPDLDFRLDVDIGAAG